MAKPIEDNDNAKEFWENLSDAAALDEPTKASLRGLLGAASIATRTTPPLNADVTSVTITGSLTYAGTPLALPPSPLPQVTENYWAAGHWSVYSDALFGNQVAHIVGAQWASPASPLATATWTPQAPAAGTPSVTVNIVEAKTTGDFCLVDDGTTITRYQNIGDDDAPNWVISKPNLKANLTGGNTFSGTQSNAGEVRSSVANTSLAASTGGFINGDTGLPNASSILTRFRSAPLANLAFTQTGITTPAVVNSRAGIYYFDGVQSNAANAVLTLTIPHLEMLGANYFPTAAIPGVVGFVLRMFSADAGKSVLREWVILGANGVNQLKVIERFSPLVVFGSDPLSGCTIAVAQPVQSQPATITLTLSTAASHRHRGQLTLNYL